MVIYEVYHCDKTIKVKADDWQFDPDDRTICFYTRKNGDKNNIAFFNFNNIVGIKEIGEVEV